MPPVESTTSSNAKAGAISIKIPMDVHHEMKIASAHRKEEMQTLLRRSWEAFKAAQGKRLHEPPQ